MDSDTVQKTKLIEVALPLDVINAASAREKSIRHGHPSTLHLWWARRPLAAARAVIWASLVDDPSAHPDQFPTEEEQAQERQRLFDILADLVKWENTNNPAVMDKARAEIRKSMGGEMPELLDPFAGGGAIPLEAQRLGLKAHAHDLNPVAVLINKAMIEIPPRFAGQAPVNPKSRNSMSGGDSWPGASGLAEDVQYYGEWMRDEAFKRIGHLYPKAQLPDGSGEATVIAWIWARTVKCPNPACGCEMPLANTFVLSKKKGNEAYIDATIDDVSGELKYAVKKGTDSPEPPKVGRGKFKCIKCGHTVDPDYIKGEGVRGKMGNVLLAVVAEGPTGRSYVTASEQDNLSAQIDVPSDVPHGKIAADLRALTTTPYGIDMFSKLFTNRQLTMLTTLSDLVTEVKHKVEEDAREAGISDPVGYGKAIAVYMAILLDKIADYHSTICSWHTTRDGITHTFARQAIPMTWDFAEANPFSNSSGSMGNMLEWIVKSLREMPASCDLEASQASAMDDIAMSNIMISTDPPYYDNIGYSDLSDYFYIWLRRSLRDTYPELFGTKLTPKKEELVATPYRFDGSKAKAKDFFEAGMLEACRRMCDAARSDVPVTIYYAFKQQESDNDGTASSGWETMLQAILQAGFQITGTWPIRTELSNRPRGQASNALASSVVLVCRKRVSDSPIATYSEFIKGLRRKLRNALEALQASSIAPVDMAQSAIGPGMAVFSQYSKVLMPDDTEMSIRDALRIINEELDSYLTEQTQSLDESSRFCLDLYKQAGWNDILFGEADVLARAQNTSVADLKANGLLFADKGKVRLLKRNEIDANRPADNVWYLTQQMAGAFDKDGGGITGAAEDAYRAGVSPEPVHDLAYQLFDLSEKKGQTADAFAYNSLVSAWPDIMSKLEEMRSKAETFEQTRLNV